MTRTFARIEMVSPPLSAPSNRYPAAGIVALRALNHAVEQRGRGRCRTCQTPRRTERLLDAQNFKLLTWRCEDSNLTENGEQHSLPLGDVYAPLIEGCVRGAMAASEWVEEEMLLRLEVDSLESGRIVEDRKSVG